MNAQTVHIRCGDDIVSVLNARLSGTAIRWADPLSEGPPRRPGAPDGAPQSGSRTQSETAQIEARCEFIARDYGDTTEGAREYLHAQDEQLAKLVQVSHEATAPRILLWFEHDLFDHVVLLYLLAWLAARGFAETDRVRLLQINSHAAIQPPDVFRGLGQLSPDDLVALYESRDGGMPLTQEHWRSAQIAFEAWLSPEPTELARIARGDLVTPGLPFLAEAFARHLREFPDRATGLGETERLILEFVQDEALSVVHIFRNFCNRDALLGLGDTMFWPRIAGLAFGKRPLLQCEAAGRKLNDSAEFYAICRSGEIEKLRELSVSITDFGRAVLAGEADHVAANGIDCWRGGVRLQSPGPVWRRDSSSEDMILA